MLGIVGFALVLLAAPALRPLLAGGGTRIAPLPVAAFGIGMSSLVAAALLLGRHFRALRRLRNGIVVLMAEASARNLPSWNDLPREAADIAEAVDALVGRLVDRRAAPDTRLAAVLASIADAIVVMTEAGQVSLVNAAAKRLLGAERVAVGTSVFAALTRDSVERAVAAARGCDHAVETTLETVAGEKITARIFELGEHGGAVLVFPLATVEIRGEIEHDLALHDVPPPAPQPDVGTPLADLPVLVLDTETTGLDVRRDAVVAIGGVRMHGTRIYRSAMIDRLVDPGRPIPPRATAIHGITDDMVRDAAEITELWPELEALMRNSVLVGHNIAFDVAILRRVTAEAGLVWSPPPCLDTMLLSAALELDLPGYGLDVLAAHFGVVLRGRHTALGDALVTAEIYQRLLFRLLDEGIDSLGAALELSRKPKSLLARQRQAGW